MAKAEIYLGEMMLKIITHQTGDLARTEYTPQKPPFPEKTDEEWQFPRSTPEEQGISSRALLQLLRQLEENPGCKIHKVMMLRNGSVILEKAKEPFSLDMWHVTHSMCKSITGMAIGLLIEEGKLQLTDRLYDIFSERRIFPSLLKPRGITVEHLLTMTSGVAFNEIGAVSGNEWKKSFMEAGISFPPGSKFEYNSMNSYMLSAIVTERTGMTMFDYLKLRLFEPMGIRRIFWETSPENITKGGWGLFMRIEDMAKMGQLYLQKGNWNGQQIIPEEWVEASLTPRVETSSEGSSHYGYQLWLNDEREGAFAFNGMLGQNVYCYPDINVVLVTNAGNEEIFQKGAMSAVVQNFMKDLSVNDWNPEDYAAQRKLQVCGRTSGSLSQKLQVCGRTSGDLSQKLQVCGRTSGCPSQDSAQSNQGHPAILFGGWQNTGRSKNLRTHGRTVGKTAGKWSRGIGDGVKRPFTSAQLLQKERKLLEQISGSYYQLQKKGAGVMPLLAQIMHNNFTDGINRISFHWEGQRDAFEMDILEGEQLYRLNCGLNGTYGYSDLLLRGECYHIAAGTVSTGDEYDRPVLRTEIVFLEEATSRTLNIHFGEKNHMLYGVKDSESGTPQPPDLIEVRMDETPGSELLLSTLDSIRPEGVLESIVMQRLAELGAVETFHEAQERAICPVMRGHRILGETVPDEVLAALL